MSPVESDSRTNADHIIMKFLVLALCVCAASAASVFKPWQPFQQGAKAVATAVVTAPEVAAKTVYTPAKALIEPVKPVVYEPVKPVVYEPVKPVVYEPVVKSAVYVDKDASAAIIRSDSDVAADGYNYAYETANGIAGQSSGVLKKVGDSEFLTSQGQFRYTAPDGTPVELSYIADENGYQPQSNVLPVGPAIPEAILRSLEYIRTHPSVDQK